MKYDITKSSFPTMPKLGKGTEIVQLLLSMCSKDMREPIALMLSPILSSYVSGARFVYPNNSQQELCGQMACLVGPSGIGKGQLSYVVEAICRSMREKDEATMRTLQEWTGQVKALGANKEKPQRPQTPILFPPSNCTNAALLLNADQLEKNGGLTQYLNLEEVEMANDICGGHRHVTLTMRVAFDAQRLGSLRASIDGVSTNSTLRMNLTMSGTPSTVTEFFKKRDLQNGCLGRITFAYIPRKERSGRIPKLRKMTSEFYELLDVYIERLKSFKGQQIIIKPLNKLIEQLAEDMAELADLFDDDLFHDLSKRALVSAWKMGCLLWIANQQTWTKSMAQLVEWVVAYNLKSKLILFENILTKPAEEEKHRGPKNLLDNLPDSFTLQQLETERVKEGKDREGTKRLINTWHCRKFITFNPQTGLYSKTEDYLLKKKGKK